LIVFLHLERAGVVHSGPFQAIPAHSELISGPFQQSLHSEPIVMGHSSSIPAVPDPFRRIPAYSLPSVPIPAHSVPFRPSRPSSVSQICEQNLSKNLSKHLSKNLSKIRPSPVGESPCKSWIWGLQFYSDVYSDVFSAFSQMFTQI